MGIPVVIKPSGGMPVTIATNGRGTPMLVATNGYGIAVTQATNGLPVVGIAFGPTLQLTGNFVAENAAINTTVGTVSVTSGTTGTPTYTLTDSAGGKFNLSGSTLRTNAALDYETATSHNVTVSVSGLTPTVSPATFTVIVTNVDDTAPLITSTNTVSNAEGTVLAHTLTANETVTWAIVAGGADNARFELSGSTLRWLSNGVKDYEAPNDADANNSYVVTVRATDTALNVSVTQTITVTVTDVVGAAPDAPVLDLLTDGTDNTPDFTLTGDLVLGDTVRFQYSTSAVFSGASETTNTIDAGEDAANSLDFATGALANGTWYFRARIERPGVPEPGVSAWSNTETIAISVVSAYQGPGDVVTTGWLAWWGFRAFSAATRGTPCCRMRHILVPNAEQDFSTNATTGLVDTAAMATWAALNGGATCAVLYDQSGNSRHASGAAVLNLAASGSLPALNYSAITGTIVNRPQPITLVAAALQNSGDGQAPIMSADGGIQIGMSVSGTPNTAYLYAGTILSRAAADNTPHVVIGVFNGGSSVISVDNVETSGAGGAAPTGTGFSFGVATLKFVFEGGALDVALDAGARSSLSVNGKTHFGIT